MWTWMQHAETEGVQRFPTATAEYWTARGWVACDDPDVEPDPVPTPAPVDLPAPSGPVRSARKAKDNG